MCPISWADMKNPHRYSFYSMFSSLFSAADGHVNLGAPRWNLHRERKPTPILTKLSPKIYHNITQLRKLERGENITNSRHGREKKFFWLVTVCKNPKTWGSPSLGWGEKTETSFGEIFCGFRFRIEKHI